MFYQMNPKAGKHMNEAYIHFVSFFLIPVGACSGKPWWPRWDSDNQQLANFSEATKGLMRDSYRGEGLDFWRARSVDLRM
jgi:hypothetical protein